MMIDSFRGPYHFLSNFYPAEVKYQGVFYPTVEHAYQAAKTEDKPDQEQIRQSPTPGAAKRLGRRVDIRPDWESVKLAVMEQLIEDKFRRHPVLTQLLIQTGDEDLVEGNNWGDTYWGVCRNRGENHLGRILMRVRSELRVPQIMARRRPRAGRRH